MQRETRRTRLEVVLGSDAAWSALLEVIAGGATQAKPVVLRAWKDAAILSGIVINAQTKQPLPGAAMQVICTTRICAGFTETADALGQFEIKLWPDLQSEVSIEAPGYQPQVVGIAPLGPRNQKAIEIALVPLNP